MSETQLSIAYGPRVDDLDRSHLQQFQEIVKATPDATAIISPSRTTKELAGCNECHIEFNRQEWTYRELDSGARRLAAIIGTLTAYEKRPILAILRNEAEWALFFWATAYVQCPFVPLNPAVIVRNDEMSHILRTVEPMMVVAGDYETAGKLENYLEDSHTKLTAVKLLLEQGCEQHLRSWTSLEHSIIAPPTPPRTPTTPTTDDATVILFTSGTTSLPKPCALTSSQCVNAALGLMDAHDVQAHHVLVQHLPGFHSYGLGWPLGFWLHGATVVFSSPSFDAQASLRCIEQHQVTHMPLVPTIAQAMLAQQATATLDFTSIVSVDLAGADISPALIDACQATFRATVTSSYGMTESPGTLAWPSRAGSVRHSEGVVSGFPVRNTVVKICEPGTHRVLPRGQAGELHNGGRQVIREYLKQETSTSTLYQDDQGTRWINSGDQAIMDELGAIRICGRYKDMIIRGGENIAPASIEAYFSKQAGVTGVQVVGVSDELAGEVPVAVVDAANESNADLALLKQDALHDLGPALAPKAILYLRRDLGLMTFPTTASGKVRKRELAEVVSNVLATQETSIISDNISTLDSLLGIWHEISGHDLCQPHTLVASFADSIMLMQLSSHVKRRLKKDVTVENFKTCDTILDQANLIDSTKERLTITIPDLQNEARQAATDELQTRLASEIAHGLRISVTKVLEHNSFEWTDVENIVPLPDWPAVFCQRSRPSSWNLRFSYYAQVDVDRLASAVKTSLSLHSTFRALCVKHEEEHSLVTLCPTPAVIEKIVTAGWKVAKKEDLNGLLLHDPVLDNACAPGPLARFHVASIEDDGTSGLVVVLSHAVSDMTMARLWLDDVAAILTQGCSREVHVPFKLYADTFHRHRTGPDADHSVAYWTKKLRGIGSTPEHTLWPPQRAPEWFKGVDRGWNRASGKRARDNERTLSMVTKLQAQRGIRKRIEVRDIFDLKREHGIPVYMLVKTAIVIMNVALTGGTEAIFSTINAARSWPFSNDYIEAERELSAMNPLDISGCTTEYVLDRIQVGRRKSILATMKQVTEEEEFNTLHAHAPFFRIVDGLRDTLDYDDNRTFVQRERDAEALLPLIRRQSFNWQPFTPGLDSGESLRFQEMVSRMDNGLTILGFLAEDKRSVVLSFSWDAEHLTLKEAQAALELLCTLVETMGMRECWEMSVDDLIRT